MARTGTLVLKVRCAICGTDRIQLPDNATDDSDVLCIANHPLGPYRSVKDALIDGPISSAANVDCSKPIFEPFKKESVQTTVKQPKVGWSDDDGDPYLRFFWIDGTHTDVKMAHDLLAELGDIIPKKLDKQTLKPAS
jgi:hypothetical protein